MGKRKEQLQELKNTVRDLNVELGHMANNKEASKRGRERDRCYRDIGINRERVDRATETLVTVARELQEAIENEKARLEAYQENSSEELQRAYFEASQLTNAKQEENEAAKRELAAANEEQRRLIEKCSELEAEDDAYFQQQEAVRARINQLRDEIRRLENEIQSNPKGFKGLYKTLGF